MEGYKYAFTQSGFTGPINYYRNALFSDLPRGLCATKIKAPTLVVWVSPVSYENGNKKQWQLQAV